MRKLLLASVAALGASLGWANIAAAQEVTYSESPSAPGVAALPPPIVYSPKRGGSVGATPPEIPPGQMVVRLGGYYAEYFGAAWSQPRNIGGNKTANYDMFGYARLYPSLEGRAANGLKYGAFLEIRQDRNFPAGGGAGGSISGESGTRGQLYFRRAFGYVGLDNLGTLRIGSGDQPSSLFMTGTFENFDNGGWNGDLPGDGAMTGILPSWPFADVGSRYTTDKIVYLSPNFYGFDFGLSYEPNTGNLNVNTGCGIGGQPGNTGTFAGCDALSSTVIGGELARRRNTFDGVMRYRGTFGPVGIAATAGYMASGHVGDNGAPVTATRYSGLSVGDFGATATFAGFSVGGHVDYGNFNASNGWSSGLNPVGEPNSVAWVVGASYTVGPLVAGLQYFRSDSAGAQNASNNLTVGQRMDRGFAAGATYTVTPGFGLFLSYIYGTRKQSGWDAVAGTAGPDNNNFHAQAVAIGTQFKW